MTEQQASTTATATGHGIGIRSAKIVDGKLTDISLDGTPVSGIEFAFACVKSSMTMLQNVQRPLQRKFDTILEKLTALKADIQTELDTRAERERVKDHRDVQKMCELLAKARKGY